MAQDSQEMPQDGSEDAPRRSQNAPRQLQEANYLPKEAPQETKIHQKPTEKNNDVRFLAFPLPMAI
eukprot:1767796-Pyramimonas_sp.AAC.1